MYDVEGVRRAPPAVRNRVLQICMMVLADKEEGNSHSATDYQRSMRTIWEILRSCSGVEERLVADLLPTLFTGALSMLEDWGMTDGFLRQGVFRIHSVAGQGASSTPPAMCLSAKNCSCISS